MTTRRLWNFFKRAMILSMALMVLGLSTQTGRLQAQEVPPLLKVEWAKIDYTSRLEWNGGPVSVQVRYSHFPPENFMETGPFIRSYAVGVTSANEITLAWNGNNFGTYWSSTMICSPGPVVQLVGKKIEISNPSEEGWTLVESRYLPAISLEPGETLLYPFEGEKTVEVWSQAGLCSRVWWKKQYEYFLPLVYR